MTIYSYDRDVIKKRLQMLDKTKSIAFGILALERALPNYFEFQIESGSLGGAELRAASAQCWAALELAPHSGSTFVTVEACEEFLPDPDDHNTSAYTSAALDAVNIACCLLTYLDSGDVPTLMEIVEARWDTLYLFIGNGMEIQPSAPGFQEEILHHPLMQEELSFVYEDIDFLHALPGDSKSVLAATIRRTNLQDYRRLRLKNFDSY
ncbi:MAG TPA: DUF416 family protein [Rhodanobacter sp.]|nr:DUF416 family protein [Rhodanobacter sp.]